MAFFAKASLKIAIDNGDNKSIRFYNSHITIFEEQNLYEKAHYLTCVQKYYAMGNIPQSLYYFLLLINNSPEIWRFGIVDKNTDYYYVILALMAKNNGNLDDYINNLKLSGLILNEDYFNPNFEKTELMQTAGDLLEFFEYILKNLSNSGMNSEFVSFLLE